MTETHLNVCMSKYIHVVNENSPVPTGLEILKITNIIFTENSLCTLYVPLKKKSVYFIIMHENQNS